METLSAIVEQQQLNPETIIPIVYQPQVSTLMLTIPTHVSSCVQPRFVLKRLDCEAIPYTLPCIAWLLGCLVPLVRVLTFRNLQAVFRVRGISQCSATIPGHADNIVDAYFSPDGRSVPLHGHVTLSRLIAHVVFSVSNLATGSGDKTVRFWDVSTMTPKKTCKGHKHWVQCIAWSPDGVYVASGGRDNEVSS